MGLKTNFNQPPYFNDYQAEQNYYRVLFKPGFSVQTRELHLMQEYPQQQLERLADNIFERGTIISGVNFNFFSPYPYVKLLDLQVDSDYPVVPADYVGAIAEDEGTGLKAYIVNYADGYEASDPDMKTLYVKYINSGHSGTLSQFTPGNTIVISSGDKPIWRIGVNSGGIGFSNNDSVVITSALLISPEFGGYSNSDFIIDPLTGANAEIIEVDDDAVPGKQVLKIKPKSDDLINPTVNSASWTFPLYATVTNQSNTVSGTVEQIYGHGATAAVRTNAVGNILELNLTNNGSDYTVVPAVSIKTANSSATIGSIDLEAFNYKAKVEIHNGVDAVGNGYAFGVSDGIIYDLGHMLTVDPQVVIVEKYNNQPNNKVVGFITNEEIVNFRVDSSLLDNALETENQTAPGADRLKLTPKLHVTEKNIIASNVEFLTLVEWNSGSPVIQNKTTQYSRLGDQMAQTVYDQNGNFVLDAFQITTSSPQNPALESSHYSVVVDPGQAYINGRKVQTLANYRIDLSKGTDTKTTNNYVSMHYGNFIRIKEVGGSFDISTGDEVSFYNRAKQYLSTTSNFANANTNAVGTVLGTAKIRSIELENGQPGLADTTYRLYLFDVQTNPGKSFDDIKSVRLGGANPAIADLVLEPHPSTGANIAVIKEKQYNSLLFPAGCESLKNSNNSTYQYKTTIQANTTISTGQIGLSISTSNEFFPHGLNQALTPSQLQQFIVVPTQNNLISNTAIPGIVETNTNSVEVIGDTHNFFEHFEPGDYVYVSNGSFEFIRRVTAVVSTNSVRLNSPPSFAAADATIRRAFPQNVPIPFGHRHGLTGQIDSSGQAVTLQFRHSNNSPMGFTFGSGQLATGVTTNIERRDVQSSLKTAIRNRYVKIRISDNSDGVNGPWCIGVPDAFRLRAVYRGDENVSPTSSDVTKNFYLDHNQNANYMGLGYLYLSPQATIRPSISDYLLVCFDYYTRDDSGYYDTRSYLRTGNTEAIAIQDALTFAELSVSPGSNSWEVPQVYTYDSKYYDLLNTFDFRPTIDSTASPTESWENAPINPSENITFSAMSKFPVPSGIMRTTQEQYLGRVDDIYIGESGNIYALKGIPDVDPRRRWLSNHPKDSLKLQMMNIPPYPNITETVSPTVLRIMDTNVYNEKTSGVRIRTRKISPILTSTNLQTSQPMVYTMEDIANLERRIKDLEYYQGLSLLETSITNKIIPSSLDRSMNRFKYGFFADDFSTPIYTDVDNPQYAASFESEGDIEWGLSGNPLEESTAKADASNPLSTSIYQPTKLIQKITSRVAPLKYNWSMRHLTENMFFIDEMVLSQNNATHSPIINDPCTILTSTNLTSLQQGFAYYTSVNKRSSAVYTENVAGLVTVYFNVYGSRTNGDLGTRINVYDANNQIVASSDASRNEVRNLTAEDRSFLTSSAQAKSFHDSIAPTNYDNATRFDANTLNNYIIGAGKFTFNNKTGGKFTILADSIDNNPQHKFIVKYPSIFSVDQNVINKPNCEPANPPNYRGTLAAGSLTLLQWSCSNKFRVNSTNYKAFILQATGLKPNTVHKLYMDSVEWPHVLTLTLDMIKQARYEPRWKKNSQGKANENLMTLVASQKYKVNEITRFLSQSRARLYNEDGSPTNQTIIKTNAQGVAQILVFFPIDVAGWFSQDFNATAYGETQTGTSSHINNINYSSGKLKPTQGSSGYTSLELTNGTDSFAIRVFANRTPTKTLPADPMGTI